METSEMVACSDGWWTEVGVVNSEQRKKPKNASRNMDSSVLSVNGDR